MRVTRTGVAWAGLGQLISVKAMIVVDLDLLAPKPFRIKVAGQEIEIQPPTVEQALIFTEASNQFSNVAGKSREEIETAVHNLRTVLIEIIPPLANINLSVKQFITLVTEMSQHIYPETDKNKATEEKRGS